jgi:hypothetical protein
MLDRRDLAIQTIVVSPSVLNFERLLTGWITDSTRRPRYSNSLRSQQRWQSNARRPIPHPPLRPFEELLASNCQGCDRSVWSDGVQCEFPFRPPCGTMLTMRYSSSFTCLACCAEWVSPHVVQSWPRLTVGGQAAMPSPSTSSDRGPSTRLPLRQVKLPSPPLETPASHSAASPLASTSTSPATSPPELPPPTRAHPEEPHSTVSSEQ